MPVAIINRIVAEDEETLEKLIERFKNRKKLVDKMPGFLGIELLVNKNDKEVLVITKWDSLENLEKWIESEEFKKAHSMRQGERINARSKGSIYEILKI